MGASAVEQTIRPYNFRIGKVTMDVGAGVSVEATDNVGISEKDRRADVSIRPGISLGTEWVLTQKNTLKLNIGVGFAHYLNNSQLDSQTLTIDPGTALEFDVFLGKYVRLNFHDRISIIQNPVDDPALSNVAPFNRLQNAAGVSGFVDLNDVNFTFGYDHYTYKTFGTEFSFLDHSEEQFYGGAGIRLSDAISTGIQGSFTLIDYDGEFNNDGTSWSVGPYLDLTLSRYTRFHAAAGYQQMSFDKGGMNGDTSDAGSWYANMSLTHRLSQYWSHSAIIGHETRLGLAVNTSEYDFARYTATWKMNSRTTLAIESFAERANESGTTLMLSESLFRYGFGLSSKWQLSDKMTAGLSYRFVDKNSDRELRSYYQNTAAFSLIYDF